MLDKGDKEKGGGPFSKTAKAIVLKVVSEQAAKTPFISPCIHRNLDNIITTYDRYGGGEHV